MNTVMRYPTMWLRRSRVENVSGIPYGCTLESLWATPTLEDIKSTTDFRSRVSRWLIRLIRGIVDYYIDLAPKVKASEGTLVYTRATVSCASYPRAAVIRPHSTKMRKLYTTISEYKDHANRKRKAETLARQAFSNTVKTRQTAISGIARIKVHRRSAANRE
ncbi:hypothetical protein BDV41DRAFT_247103 [Aspergillus transmontanensis]|uniref:Uncharacterized protein n=1 Tax=Aspergillus transmontanensis TaxID=1034304 RepID=A0A5N6VZX0_9EURO|nr:hypothetical protein BDV41DRAFT_247103 [Aspergillus transmontanensis]